jgi:hypothetical protein
LVRDKHIDHLDVHAGMLYLFLVTVADARGLSWYGDNSTARRLSMDEVRLRQARLDLIRAGLLAYASGLYQVLAFGDSLMPAPCHDTAASMAQSATFAQEVRHVAVHEHLKVLHAVLGRRA